MIHYVIRVFKDGRYLPTTLSIETDVVDEFLDGSEAATEILKTLFSEARDTLK